MLKKTPALKFAIALAAGIIFGKELVFDLRILPVAIIVLSLFTAVFFKKHNDIHLIQCFAFLLIFIFGVMKAQFDFYALPDNSIKYVKETPKNSNDYLYGIITELPDYDSARVKIIVSSEIVIKGKDTLKVSGDVAASIRQSKYDKNSGFISELLPGDKVCLKGKISIPSGQRNPGEFNYAEYLSLHGIHKTFFVSGYKNVKVISHGNSGFMYQKIIYPFKIYAINCIDKYSKGDIASYLKGLVTGERSDISDGMKESFINTGVMHLIAVSGLNVAYIILFITLLLSVLRVPLLYRTILTIFILIFYSMFTGNPASIVRATIMGIILLISYLLERKVNFFNSAGVAAIIILCYDAKQLFDAGFILSFSAVISMVVIYGIFEKTILNKMQEWKMKGKSFTLGASVLFFTSLAAQLGTLPITVMYFGKISFISLLVNVIAVPAANLSLAIGFFQILISLLSDYLASLAAESNNLLLSLQLLFIKTCASLDYAFVEIYSFSFGHLLCYYLCLVLILTAKDLQTFVKRILYCLILIVFLEIFNYDFRKELRITFLDIGQGDCSLIQTPDDKVILVDCGLINENFNSGERTILPYLKRNNISKIDLLVITHLHSDHTGGLNYLLKNVKVEKLIVSGQKLNSQIYNETDSLIIANKISREIIRQGTYIDGIEDMRIYFLFPGNNFVDENGKTLDDNLNNGSVVFKIKYKKFEALFTGDIEREAENHLFLKFGNFLKSDVLKAAHHGSITSSSIPFLLKCRPKVSVISCGKFNKFNHPSEIVENRFQTAGAFVFRTDVSGAIILNTDGYNTQITATK